MVADVFSWELRKTGLKVGKNRVSKLLLSAGLKATGSHLRKVRTTLANKKAKSSPNFLAGNFSPKKANLAWVSDITYIKAKSGWLYLCIVMDLYSRKIVGCLLLI